MWSNIAITLPFAFQGLQHGIGSWFRGNNSIDSTNGHSWCGFPYRDSTPGFAIDITQMSINHPVALILSKRHQRKLAISRLVRLRKGSTDCYSLTL